MIPLSERNGQDDANDNGWNWRLFASALVKKKALVGLSLVTLILVVTVTRSSEWAVPFMGEHASGVQSTAPPGLRTLFDNATTVGSGTSVRELTMASHTRPSRTNTLGSAVLVIVTHDRIEYFTQALKSVLVARNMDQFTIAVSMDSRDHFDAIRAAAQSVNPNNHTIEFWDSVIIPAQGQSFPAEAGITRHLKVAMDRAFAVHDYAILLEDDLTVSPDFFEYFQATGHVLRAVSSGTGIYCVSAWNDQALKGFILDESRVMRTSFYPGLGVMFHRSFWVDAMDKEWPFLSSPDWGYDWWIRRHSSVRSKDCIIPEMPRTHHIARHGMHVGESAAGLYLGMPLASGNLSVSAESVAIAADETKTKLYYADIIRASKMVKPSDLNRSLVTNRGGSLVLLFNDDSVRLDDMPYSGSPELQRLLAKFQLYRDTYRSFYQRAFTFRLKEGGTRVTLIGTSTAYSYWGIDKVM